MYMIRFSKIFFELGILFLVIAGILFLVERFGFIKLPGDIVIQRKNFTFYFPIVTSIVISIILTVLLNLFFRR